MLVSNQYKGGGLKIRPLFGWRLFLTGELSGLTPGQSPLKHPGVKTQRGVKCWLGVGGPAATFITSYSRDTEMWSNGPAL